MAIRNKRAKAAEDAAVEGIGQIGGINLRSSSGSSVGGNSSIPSGMTSASASISPSAGRGVVLSPSASLRFVSSMASNIQGGHTLPIRVVPTSPLASHDGLYNTNLGANNRFNNPQSIPSSISPSAGRGVVGPPAILLQQQRDMQYQHHQREFQYQNQHYFAQQQQQQQQQVGYMNFSLFVLPVVTSSFLSSLPTPFFVRSNNNNNNNKLVPPIDFQCHNEIVLCRVNYV